MKIYEYFGSRGLIGDKDELTRGSRVELTEAEAESLLAGDFPIRLIENPGQDAPQKEDDKQ